jgi:hypothetical protein
LGGVFWYLGKRIHDLPNYILFQYIFVKKDGKLKLTSKWWLPAILLSPFYLVSLPICYFIIPLLFFYLDKLDRKKNYTLDYACYCYKGDENFAVAEFEL